MHKDLANKMSIFNIFLTFIIIVSSVYLIRHINTGDDVENFKEGCDCEASNKNQIRNEEIKGGLGNKDVDTVFGTPVAPQSAYTNKNTQENAPNVGGGEKSLFLFKHNKCTPECCDFGKGTDVSCSGGCVCYNKEQNQMISSRGDNVYPETHKSTLKFKGDKIIKDKWS
jgi:hypothetical protein|tara:strand:- start:506 stop:1012 length:507 start_codon:yes stop_codon:yes gene_type:complete